MKQYHDLCKHILENGTIKEDRTGTGTISTFGYQMRFNLEEGFPLLTTKKVALNAIIHELLWFLKGDTTLDYLVDNKVKIWNPDGYRFYKENSGNLSYEDFLDWIKDASFNLGPIYGHQWRSWPLYEKDTDLVKDSIDQIANVIEQIKKNPDSRRLIVSAWNVGQIDEMALPPCHIMFQFYVANGKLSCQLYQRSGDVFLGVPFNIASYAILTHMIAQVCGLGVGEFVHTLGDAHIYLNHIEQVKEQLSRKPRDLPKLHLNFVESIDDYEFEDVVITDYNPFPPIKGQVSVG